MQRCHTYKIAVSKYQARCEQRSEVFVKIQKNIFLGGGSGRGGGGLGGQGGCERRLEVFVRSGWGVRVDVNEELNFL